MSEHDVYARCAKQVADLQADNMSLYAQLADRESEVCERDAEISRLRAGLLAMQHEAASQTMTGTNPNATRALAARFEQRCKALLDTVNYEPPA